MPNYSVVRKIRIQPAEIEVPVDDPFKHDRLERKESIEILTNQLKQIESPCVFSINAEWGNGKTTFLKIWCQYLRNESFSVVEFNAWETDFSNTPFASLTAELLEAFQADSEKFKAAKLKKLWNIAIEIVSKTVPALTRVAVSGLAEGDVAGVAEGDVADLTVSGVSLLTEQFGLLKSNQNDVKMFKKSLGEIVESAKLNQPLIIVIDELDRCRPSYAIELLEVAKHLFSVKGIIFVLAVNLSQLTHSVSSLYGSSFDSKGYLRRFFDIDFTLPLPSENRESFIESLVDGTGINCYYSQSADRLGSNHYPNIKNLLCIFFSRSDLSLRQIEKAIVRLVLMLGSLKDYELTHGVTAAIVLILRTLSPASNFEQFVNGEISDLQFADFIFEQSGAMAFRHEKDAILLETRIVLASFEISGRPISEHNEQNSLLWQKYRDIITAANQIGTISEEELHHAVEMVNTLTRSRKESDIGFIEFVQRFALISPALIRE